MVKKWGLGGLINTERAPTGRSAGSWAWAGVTNTYFWVDPTRRVAGVLLTQFLPFSDPAVLDLLRQVRTRGVRIEGLVLQRHIRAAYLGDGGLADDQPAPPYLETRHPDGQVSLKY